MGLSAFEYCWKVFNALYTPLSGRNAKERMFKYLDLYLDKADYMKNAQRTMHSLCNCLLTADYSIDSDCPTHLFSKALQDAKKHCQNLKVALKTSDEVQGPRNLVSALYALRNARVHGERELCTTKVADVQSGQRFITILPESLLELCIYLLSGKTEQSRECIEDIITTRRLQLIDEIKNRVSKWH